MPTIGKTPIPQHPTHDVLDSTKIKSFQSCPRQFFFEHILGWRSDSPNVHLAFGSAWHESMELLHTKGMSDSHILDAIELFQEEFIKEFPPELSDEHASKNVDNAAQALKEYAQSYRHLDDFNVLYAETAGTAPVREDRVIHFKCDLIYEDGRGQIWSLEHKTTGRGGSRWKERWPLDFQVNAYNHAVAQLFADRLDRVAGVKINGAILRKSGNNEFVRIPCRKSIQQIQLFLQECNHWIDMIEWNWEALAETSVRQDTMFAFPRNPTSCTKYGCPYGSLCEHWTNPLHHCDEPPIGYEVDHWDPRRQEEEAENVVHLEQDNPEVKSNEQANKDLGSERSDVESSG